MNSNSKQSEVLVQFHSNHRNTTLTKLKNILEEHLVPIKESQLDFTNRINIYSTIEFEHQANHINSIMSKYSSSTIQKQQNKYILVCTIIYQQDNDQDLPKLPSQRTILLRECLPELLSIQYEIETTYNEMESLKHLTDLILTLISIDDDKNISFFDQKISKFDHSKNTKNKDPKDIWKNMIYQINGMQNDKVQPIVNLFPTLESLYADLGGFRTIQDISTIGQNDKIKKIKKSTIKKIQQTFLSLEAHEQMQQQ